ncbi:MAG: polyprenol monophosphomannose synthase [Candidatus Lokiarchaeota archaeon]|nr:polyprenol monophosphomannose synthase [Candidatus Lokiarchaeota archaeon]
MTATPRATKKPPVAARIVKVINPPKAQPEARGTRADPRKRVGIVLPTLEEGRNLQRLLPMLEDTFARHGIDGHLFVVDDNSRDGTDGIVRGFAREYGNITLIQRPGKLGIGSAYRLGFKHALRAGMDVIFEMDADLSHRPSYIPAFLECMERHDAGLVIGSRYCDNGGTRGWPLERRVISFVANVFTQLALGVSQTRDMTSGFRAYKSSTLGSIDYGVLTTNGYAWQIETLYRAHMGQSVIREIPILFHEREVGKSKLGYDDVKEFIIFLSKTLVRRLKLVVRHAAAARVQSTPRSR